MRLISELQETRWTGRPGYPIRAMVGMALVKSLYAIPTWSRTARLVAEHPALQAALGCAPSVYACYRFTAKLRACDGYSFWRQLPHAHAGEDVLVQLRVMERFGGCGLLPSGAYHQELPTTVADRRVDAPTVLR